MAVGTHAVESEPVAEPEARDGYVDRLYRLSLDQYHRIAEAGIIVDGEPVELLEGLLVTKMSKHPPHILATELVQQVIGRALPEGWYVSMQNPVALPADDSEPEPDAKVVRGVPRDYRLRTAGPGDVALVIEVAESSLRFDRTTKKRIYARSAVPIYWLLNLPESQLEVFTEPTGPGDDPTYRQFHVYGPDDEVPLILDGREVARIVVSDLLP